MGGLEIVLDVGLQAELFGPELDLVVEPPLAQELADVFPDLGDRRDLLAARAHLGHQGLVVIGLDLFEPDQHAGTETLLDVDQHHELPGEKLADAGLVEPELLELARHRVAAPHLGAEGVELLLDLLERHLGEAVAIDLVEAELLLDHAIEQAAPEGFVLLVLLGSGQAESHDLLELGLEDRILVDDRQNAIDELGFARRGSLAEGRRGRQHEREEKAGAAPATGSDHRPPV